MTDKDSNLYIVEYLDKTFKRSEDFEKIKSFIISNIEESLKDIDDEALNELLKDIQATDEETELMINLKVLVKYCSINKYPLTDYPINFYTFKAFDKSKARREIILYSEDTGKIDLISRNEVIKNREYITDIADWKIMHHIEGFTQEI